MFLWLFMSEESLGNQTIVDSSLWIYQLFIEPKYFWWFWCFFVSEYILVLIQVTLVSSCRNLYLSWVRYEDGIISSVSAGFIIRLGGKEGMETMTEIKRLSSSISRGRQMAKSGTEHFAHRFWNVSKRFTCFQDLHYSSHCGSNYEKVGRIVYANLKR